ncbi:uncharacterized protein DUF1553 [Roseimicrobium gellanilyticum]|uniref:Uncharacterized protein DUF1553 n=1 Tax=Roseimicrobium gellanilyticum TaxID=748857 RepID=A0A366HSC4_9BACT|nr:DUF1549 domain-containing protein [Roseimicrobium gellanilyticum]RBP45793.1 uncharacterized protein DUF1553 [Roseimicrobium gellanilyticum]
MKAILALAALTISSAVSLHAAALPEAQKIDAILAKEWEKNNLKPNPPATDEVLVRRLYLDIAGRIPTAEETQEFVRSNDPAKKTKLIDKLLGSDGYTSNMFNYWADVLRLTDNVKGRVTAEAYEEWLKKQLKANTPYDQFVRNLMTTEGGVWDSGSIGFYMRDENKLDHLAYTVQVFLGTQIVCAQCHNHPFDKWTQMDYYGMAAFTYGMDTRGYEKNALKSLAPKGKKGAKAPDVDRAALKNMTKDQRKAYMAEQRKKMEATEAEEAKKPQLSRADVEMVRKSFQDVMKPLRYTSISWTDKLPTLPADYKYPDGKAGQSIQPKVLFGHEADIAGSPTRLDAFSKWMTSPENPRFTTVIANRMWKKAFGIGLIEPVDEMMDSTVPSNNELMEYLTTLMQEKKYSLKSFLRVLYNTDTYQRMATATEVPLGETYHFTGPILRRMSAEQVWDSMVTLSRGNIDDRVEDDNVRLHQYLDDLSMFLNTVNSKGPEALVEVAKQGNAARVETDKRIAELTEQAKQMRESGGNPDAAQKLAREAARLRKGNSNDVLEALLGEERAQDLRRGYQPDKKGMSAYDKAALAALSKEERREAMKMGGSLSLNARASELPSPAKPGHFLRTFGQSDRELIQNASDDASVPQALSLLNGPASEVLGNPLSKLSQDLKNADTPQQKLELLYLSFLSRQPTNNERAVLAQVIQQRGDKAVDDVTHALLTGSQFLFIQ